MMRRILLVLTVGLAMTAMMLATAVPAFAGGGGAKDPCKFSEGTTVDCRGGMGSGGEGTGGGSGSRFIYDTITDDFSYQGGGGRGSGGGGGANCSGNFFDEDDFEDECTPRND